MKGIPGVWVNWQHIDENDSDEERARKQLMNRCLLDRRPYFFKYRYADDRREFQNYYASRNSICLAKFGMSVDQLKSASNRTEEQEYWLQRYEDFCPLIESDSEMNMLCKYLESVDFNVKQKVKGNGYFDPTEYMSDSTDWELIYNDVMSVYKRYLLDISKGIRKTWPEEQKAEQKKRLIFSLKQQLKYVCSDSRAVADALVWYAYIAVPESKKDTIWLLYGKYMVRNAEEKARARGEKETVPVKCAEEDADLFYLGSPYKMVEVDDENGLGVQNQTEDVSQTDLFDGIPE